MNEWYLSSLIQGDICFRLVNKYLANKTIMSSIYFFKCQMFVNYGGRKDFFNHLTLSKIMEDNIKDHFCNWERLSFDKNKEVLC